MQSPHNGGGPEDVRAAKFVYAPRPNKTYIGTMATETGAVFATIGLLYTRDHTQTALKIWSEMTRQELRPGVHFYRHGEMVTVLVYVKLRVSWEFAKEISPGTRLYAYTVDGYVDLINIAELECTPDEFEEFTAQAYSGGFYLAIFPSEKDGASPLWIICLDSMQEGLPPGVIRAENSFDA